MTALWVVVLLLLALVLLGQIRVGVRGSCGPEGPRAWLRLGPLSVRLWPRREKGGRKKGQPPKKKEKRPADGTKKRGTDDLWAALDYLRVLLPVALEAAGQFRRKLRVDRLFLEIRIGTGDPADTAQAYGRASAAAGALWEPLNQAFQIRDGTVRILPDLEGEKSQLRGQVSISLTVAQALRLGVYFGYKALRAFLAVKGAHDRARQERKAV